MMCALARCSAIDLSSASAWSSSPDGRGEPLSVLIIEDSEDDMALVVRELRRGGYDVLAEHVQTAEALREALGRRAWDAIIADYALPGFSGIDALAIVRGSLIDVPFIIVSGVITEEAAVGAMKGGASDYVLKSNLGRLGPALHRELAHAAERRRTAVQAAELACEQVARAEAEAAGHAKDEFLAMLSHELRTPQTALLAYTRLLRRPDVGHDVRVRALDTIERPVRVQAQLISDLLDVSRLAMGKLRLEIRPTDIAAAVGAALDVVGPIARAKGVEIVTDIDDVAQVVPGDGVRLQQVVWNLLANAVKFTPAGGRVSVSVARRDSAAVIKVADTGDGIAPEFLPFVFERVRQEGRARARDGLGLGLAIVRDLVERHGGSVRAESAGPGQGALFTVVLPG